MQVQETEEVACPKCGETSTVPIPDADVELKISPYVAAFGDHTKVDCSDGHTFWVYYC
ncbi:hypothetical protein [Halopiger xanaduensis]|uniref:Uncharacterized protein n=1 Tax=Halopiger xanaduensis (strain DSM 18323 / JCM 14033 / SH-6) TaxID=797210 RepID=F8DDJ7_HALXS|nr:hypothetical protein Halxa_0491 [Halopiger xanaduensis SH-6]